MSRSTTVLFVLTLLSGSLASQICSPFTCLKGSSSSPVLAVDASSDTYLLPGTYTTSGQLALSGLEPVTSLNETTSVTSSSLIISPPPRPVSFKSKTFTGKTSTWTSAAWSSDSWSSLYLPDGWYAVVAPGETLWSAIPDSDQLPSQLSRKISKAASSACNPPCSSNGVCTPSTTGNSSATCACTSGWTGASCDTCATGYYGSTCKTCASNCTVCDDGLDGTGSCLGTATDSSDECNCLHGTCTGSGDCICSAGYITNSTSGDAKCWTCAAGFYQDSTGNCSGGMSFGVLQLHASIRHQLDCDLHELRIRHVPQHCQPCDLPSLERELFVWDLLELDELVVSELFSRLLVVYWPFDVRLPRLRIATRQSSRLMCRQM
ncbi:hypothetical protein EHS25_002642 [Saitozyma podzolica]|uniref:EGF-like domain-containing protein n=1 Tax=Saitozyma podzolica TaxID=1890683 RepID=A0A427YCX1_9TREE|nr:hypothetical protein EHS25_002642 [Saitozyma podzolica]